AAFVARYEKESGTRLFIRQSHGGSGSQARAVIDGLPADVASLALWTDTDAIRRNGRIDPGPTGHWEDKLPNRSLPYVSTIVLVVRRGNPKGVRDWPDLARPDVGVTTPNPKTAGQGTRAEAEAYLRFLYTPEAQEIIAKHHHRPTDPAVFARHRERFPELDLRRATTLVASGRWDDVQRRFFAEGGVFDQIYAAGR